MADKIQDAEDRLLASLLQSDPIPDDGFSASIVGKVRRRLWVRRLAVPIAAVIGGALAFRPLSNGVAVLADLSSLVPKEVVNSATSSLPQMPLIMLGAALLASCLIGLRFLED